MKAAGNKQSDIAGLIGATPGTVSRELRRNTGTQGYDAEQAQAKAGKRRRHAAKAVKMTPSLVAAIEEKLRLDWSPEQVSGWLEEQRGSRIISHGRIYRHVWADKRQGGMLWQHLRQCHKKRRKQYGSTDKRGQIRNRVSIDERPAVVEEKSRIGDWETGTVIGKNHQGALVTIADRKSKYTLIKKVGSKHAETVTEAAVILLKPFEDKALTITADNGKEFAGHEKIAEGLKAKVYFAHPYHSWERGLNENTNGLVRQYFTKGSSFENISEADVVAVMDKPGHRPRKSLGYKSPHEVFFADPLQEAA